MPETIQSLSFHLRRMADGPVDLIDAERLSRAADELERLKRENDLWVPARDIPGDFFITTGGVDKPQTS